jgi:hypothetical protein
VPRLHDFYQEPDGSLTVKLVHEDGEIEVFKNMALDLERFGKNLPPEPDTVLIEPVRVVKLPHPGARAFGWSRTTN